ncbi:MAG: PAS domain-containing sensor histidine kinase [Pseudomonadota bacterium]
MMIKRRKLVFVVLLGVITLVAGLGVATNYLVVQDAKDAREDMINMGGQVVSFLALYPPELLYGNNSLLLQKTITEHIPASMFGYLLVLDSLGKPMVTLGRDTLVGKIPDHVAVEALSAIGFFTQSFIIDEGGSGRVLYEFSRPVYASGGQIALVRLGLMLKSSSVFTFEHYIILAIFLLLVCAVIVFYYYGLQIVIKPIAELNSRLKDIAGGPTAIKVLQRNNPGIGSVLGGVHDALAVMQKKSSQLEHENKHLLSHLGAVLFEKKQAMNALDSVRFGVVVTDMQDNVAHINLYMLNLLKKKANDVLGRPVKEIFKHNEVFSLLANTEASGRSRSDVTLPDLAPGEVFKVSANRLMGDGETPIGKMISFSNITNEIRAEKGKQDFIDHVAHELLTPLTNVKSYSELLMDGEVTNIEMQKEFYNTINDQTNRLTSMIKNLLNISRMETGALSLDKGLVRTDWFVEDCLSAIEGSARDKGITIVKRMPDIFPSLMADKEMMKAALINLLGNAVKYTPQGGVVNFSIAEEEGTVVFEVADTGYGISAEDILHIFDKFYRSKDPRITEQVGSGLGLALTSEIVRLHDGEIDVESEVGKGTRFTMRIPKEKYYVVGQQQ